MSTRNFPSWLDAFVELYDNIKAPRCYKYWTAMSTLAGAVERKLWWTNGNFWWYPNLYVFLVGERSSGKSTVAGKALDMLWEVPEFELAPTEMNAASILFTLKDVGSRREFEFHGKRYKNSSMYLYGSEAVKVFGEMAGKDSGIKNTLVELYNSGDSFWTDKPCMKKSTRTFGVESVYNPCLNILACSTATWLMTKIMLRGDVEGGLGSRFLFAVFPDDAPEGRETNIPGIEHFAKRDLLAADLRQIATLKGGFEASKAWIKAFDAYNVQHDRAQKVMKFRDPMLQGCLARKANTQLPKLSMLLSLSEGDSLKLEERHAHAAWQLLNDLEKDMPSAFGRFGVSEEVQHINEVVQYIEHADLKHVSMTDLCKVFKKQFTSKRIQEVVVNLVHQGKLEYDPTQSRPKERVYRVNLPGRMPESQKPESSKVPNSHTRPS